MKKLVSGLIFLGLVIATFCSSGWMANTVNAMHGHGTDHVSECCDYETASGHHIEETIAIASLFNDFAVPAALLILVLTVVFLQEKPPSFVGNYLPYFFHKFSRGVFQLE